jgi:hypothetical protein
MERAVGVVVPPCSDFVLRVSLDAPVISGGHVSGEPSSASILASRRSNAFVIATGGRLPSSEGGPRWAPVMHLTALPL